MRSSPVSQRTGAFTLVELLCVIAIIGILAALLLPALTQGQSRARLVWCGNNLAQIGLGFQAFAHEHNSKFPLQVPAGDGGAADTASLNANGLDFSGASFAAMAADLATPQIVVCPTDNRSAAPSFTGLQPANVSYFTSAGASYDTPESVVAGDRNITAGSGAMAADGSRQFQWTASLHQLRGNLLYADGHVAAARDFLLAYNSAGNSPGNSRNHSGPGENISARSPRATPLTPAQWNAVNAALSHAGRGFPTAFFMPVLAAQAAAAPDTGTAAGGSSIPAPAAPPATATTNPLPDVAATPAPATGQTDAVATATDDEPPVGNIFVRRERPAWYPPYVAAGSWLLLVIAAAVFAYRLGLRHRPATPKPPGTPAR